MRDRQEVGGEKVADEGWMRDGQQMKMRDRKQREERWMRNGRKADKIPMRDRLETGERCHNTNFKTELSLLGFHNQVSNISTSSFPGWRKNISGYQIWISLSNLSLPWQAHFYQSSQVVCICASCKTQLFIFIIKWKWKNCLNSDSGGDAEWWNLTNKSGSRQKPNEMTKPETEVVWKCLLPFIIENYFYQLVTYLLLQQLWHNFHVPFLKQLPRWKSFKTTQLIKECANHNSIPV